MDWMTTAVPTFYENWPEALQRLSMATLVYQMTQDEMKALGAAGFEVYSRDPRNPDLERSLQAKLGEMLGHFPMGGFVKLGSRSPKDSWVGAKMRFCAHTAADAWLFLTDCSERIAEDLSMGLSHNYNHTLLVRDWKNIPSHEEWRCFVKGGHLVGISQYDYHHVYDEIPSDHSGLQWAIERYFASQILPALHLKDVVVDVWMHPMYPTGPIQTTVYTGTLVEINPWWAWTDPCLFDWNKDKFEELEFRVAQKPAG